MLINIVTAITRPENLSNICPSLTVAAVRADVDIVWHWAFDLKKENIGGQKIKNDVLDNIVDGWVWILDDDTTVHPDIFAEFKKTIGNAQAFVVSQQRKDGYILTASPENSRVNKIDAGQAIVHRSAIGDCRLPELYNGDGIYLEEVLQNCEVVYSDKILSYHNAI